MALTTMSFVAALVRCTTLLYSCTSPATVARAFSPGAGSDVPFSLSAYRRARARETSANLDASRFHFQILFVDGDNFGGRIAEGMLAEIAEYNDAMCMLFPYSATIETSPNAPADSAAPPEAVAACESLGLCSTTCAEDGTSFDLACLDQYDLIIAMDDEIQSLILRSLPPGGGYENRCRQLSEFLSVDFCGVQTKDGITDKDSLYDMIEQGLWDRVAPFHDLAQGAGSDVFSDRSAAEASTTADGRGMDQPRMVLSQSGAAVPNRTGWPLVEAAMLVACAGITRFCLDTMNAQFDAAFQTLLDGHFHRPEHLEYSIQQADDQLRLGSLSVTGYFSPNERHKRIEDHFEELRSKLL